MRIETVGVVGLGNMGLGMARSLVRAGFDVLGQDIDQTRQAGAEEAGFHFVSNVTDLLVRADSVVFSLPRADDVEAVVMAQGGLLTRSDRKVVVIDTSTSDPGTSRRLAACLAAAGHALLDAPVSGGPSGARDGRLTMMVGGEADDIALAKPVIAALSASAIHVGPSGSGNIAKLVNNLLVAAHLITTGEAMRLSAAAGLAPEDALKVVNTATGRSVISEVMYPKWILPGTFNSGFSAGLMRKDVGLALELAATSNSYLPLSEHIGEIWANAEWLSDHDDFTHMADFRHKEELA